MNEQQERVLMVLSRMAELVEQDTWYAEIFSNHLEDMLTEIHNNDTFGTEGQNDPRGDYRDKYWSMDCVEGVD